MKQQSTSGLLLLPLILTLAACDNRKPDKDGPAAAARNLSTTVMNHGTAEENVNAAVPAGKSIIRPSIVEPPAAPRPEPITITLHFPDRGMKLDAPAQEQIDRLLAEPLMAEHGPIVLRGHSDARGSDRDNLLASRHRAEAVRDYLLAKGVAAERITVIALGEYRPIAPNAHADGSDDPDSRAKNRRVEIEAGLPPATPPANAPTAPAQEDE